MLVESLILIAIILLSYRRWVKRNIFKLGKQLNSGILALPFVGHSYLFIGDNLTRMKAFQSLGRDAIRKEDGLTTFWLGTYLYTMIAEPEAADLVLKTCLEKDDLMNMLKLFLGNASIFAPVSIWRPRRKVLVPSFSIKNLKYFMTIFVEQSRILAQNLGKVAGTGPVPAWRYFTAYTMDAIAESTLGFRMGVQKNPDHPFLHAFDEGLRGLAERICQPWLHSDVVYASLPVYPKQMKIKKYLWDCITKFIKTKKKEMKDDNGGQENDLSKDSPGGGSTSLLESLIRLSGGDKGYTDIELVEELLMILVAGNDTSAVGASFISLMLSRHLEVQQKVFEELNEVFGDSDRPVTFEDLPRLKYLDAVIRETLRLYPPVPVITRKVEKNFVLPTGITIVPGTGVVVNIWALHRNPRYWGEDAELFRPERFIDTPLQHPAIFMPFSHGPRNCAGYQYAMTSMKTVLSTLLRQYRILPATALNSNSEYPPLRLKFDIMMKDEDGCQIRIEPR